MHLNKTKSDYILSEEDIADIKKAFQINRPKLPIMFIVTPNEKTSPWTRLEPTGPVLSRLALLARESHAVFLGQLTNIVSGTDFKVGEMYRF